MSRNRWKGNYWRQFGHNTKYNSAAKRLFNCKVKGL